MMGQARVSAVGWWPASFRGPPLGQFSWPSVGPQYGHRWAVLLAVYGQVQMALTRGARL